MNFYAHYLTRISAWLLKTDEIENNFIYVNSVLNKCTNPTTIQLIFIRNLKQHDK